MKSNLQLKAFLICVAPLALQLLAIEAHAVPVPDTSFGTNGMMRIGVPAPAEDFATVSALQRDEKLLIAGSTAGRAFVLRLNADGAPDSTFGNGGLALFDLSNSYKFGIEQIEQRPDGTLLVGGLVAQAGGMGIVVARLIGQRHFSLLCDTEQSAGTKSLLPFRCH